jgi:3-isopropylmalate/(R)-2-methylmalate dehydratase small subunit
MEPITTITSRTVVLPVENVDTDQIIPARFLTTTSRNGLGKHAFADWRYAPDGSPVADFPLNRPDAKGAQILVAGRNFGCGSSREHAPWALLDAGLRAVVSTQFADIFRANATRNGLLPIVVDGATHAWLVAHAGATVTVDLAASTIAAAAGGPTASFPFDPFAKHCLVHGVDEMGFLLSHEDRIAEHEAKMARVA